jgi:hypothetical protein
VSEIDQPDNISPEDEERVRAALRPLAEVTMPTEVASRIDEVLHSEAADLTRRVEETGDGDERRARASAEQSLRRRQQVMVGAFAAFIVIVIAGIVVSSHHTATTASSSGGAPVLTDGTSITDSGNSWSPEDLQTTLRRTLTGPVASQVPQSATSAAPSPHAHVAGPAGSLVSSQSSPVAGNADGVTNTGAEADPTDQAGVAALIENPTARQACINALKEPAGTEPIAVDAGTFNGSPAVAFLFPSSAAANHVDIYVVGPKCSAHEPNVLLFDRLPRP